MLIESAIIERLESIPAVTAIVGDRIYQLKLPQRPTLPAIRVQLIDEIPTYHLRGPNGLMPSRVQFDAFVAEEPSVDWYRQAEDLAAAIDTAWTVGASPAAGWGGVGVAPPGLSGWRGPLGGSPPEYFVWFARRIDRGVTYEAAEIRSCRIRQDFLIWWSLFG